ncbi:MAG: beta-lactamase family protein [Aestuariibacter sp.]|nr:beta-lactamase family protein [Aestuariibacter sp.]
MKRILLWSSLLMLLFSATASVTAQEAAMPAENGTIEDTAHLAPLLDTFFAEELPASNIPGAAFVMVKDGEIVLSEGYGYADVEQKIPYDPADTIVRAGSTVKLITAVAVMQLAEQGIVDVHADVNQYLTGFQLDNPFDEPVTLHHLLHHTSGIDVQYIGIREHDVADLQPLGAFLADNLPPVVMPPGQYRNYNDYGIALAGLVVEEMSGMPYAEYVTNHIFEPLDMNSSYIMVPDAELDRMAISYTESGDDVTPLLTGNYILNTAPGAVINSTPHDIANFMMAYLADGRFQDVRILQEATMQEMKQRQFTHHDALPGMAYAFDEMFINGHRVLAKSGGAPGMQSRMVLLPDENIGFFVTYNRYLGGFHNELTTLIMDTYFPRDGEIPPPQAIPLSAAEAQKYDGYYLEILGYSDSSLEKVNFLFNQSKVTPQADGTLELWNSSLIPVAPDQFQWADGERQVVFETDANGEVSHLLVNRTPYLKLPWYQVLPVQLGILGGSLLLFIVGIILWIVASRNGNGGQMGIAAAVSGLNLLFVIGLALFMLTLVGGSEPPWDLFYGAPTTLLVLLVIPIVTALLTIMLVVWFVVNWMQGGGTAVANIGNLIVLVGSVGLLFFLQTWNLLGYKF